MSVKSTNEVLEQMKNILGENTSDEALALVEDVTDTLKDFENKTKDQTNWEQKYRDNDAEWRQKYKDRFFSTPSNEELPPSPEGSDDEPKPLTYDSLFKEG